MDILLFIGFSCILAIPTSGRIISVSVDHHGKGHHRPCDLTSNLHLRVQDGGLSTTIAMHRARSEVIPVSLMKNAGEGKLVPELWKRIEGLGKHYEDNHDVGSVRIRCSLTEERKPLYEVSGFLTIRDSIYLITPSRHTPKQPHHHPKTNFHRLHPLLTENNPFKHKDHHDHKRHHWKRQAVPEYFIDVRVIVDFKLFEHWLRLSDGATAALKTQAARDNIARYIALIFKGVNLRYASISEYKIKVNLVELTISETSSTSPWTKPFEVGGQINANSSLWSLRQYVDAAGPPTNDHVMLFTGYDLVSDDTGVLFNYTTGQAFVGTMCDPNGASVSIIEDHAAFQSVHTTAHELAHSLNATHDGKQNPCSTKDRYIMAAGPVQATEANRANPWLFSSCSVSEMGAFIAETTKTVGGSSCLNQARTKDPVFPDVQNVYPGQLYTPDQQCRHFYGDGSNYCRGRVFGTVDHICYSMFCRNPGESTCIELHAADKTSCGNKKWCVGGKCVASNLAPAKDDSCVHGDEPRRAFNGKTCSELIAESTAYCYDSETRIYCCDTCRQVRQNVEGCEYGDKVTLCRSTHCKSINSSGVVIDDQCCGTCSFSPEQWQCTDRSTTPGLDCSRILAHQCYNLNVAYQCCATCSRFRENKIEGCEYGDRASACSTISLNGERCDSDTNVKYTCCKTCDIKQATQPTNRSPSRFASLKILFTVTIILQAILGVFS